MVEPMIHLVGTVVDEEGTHDGKCDVGEEGLDEGEVVLRALSDVSVIEGL